MSDLIAISCSRCGQGKDAKAGKQGAKLPRGWKRREDEIICPACWSKAFVLRALTMPVAGPHGDLDWPGLRESLSGAWRDATSLANWAITELAKADVIRRPDMDKMPPAPQPYLYPGARVRCPQMDPQSVVSLLHAVEGKYRATRYDVLWRGAASLPNFRYPMPYPVNAQGWTPFWLSEKERVPLISLRLRGQRIVLRLRGGHEFRRQLAAFSKMVDGTAVPVEMALYRRNVSSGAHRPGIGDHGNGGEQRAMTRVMAKLVVWLPRDAQSARESDSVLLVSSSDSALFHATIPGDEKPWVLHADHVRRWIATGRTRTSRLHDDRKAERRRDPQIRDAFAQVSRKLRNRLDTFTHQASASLVAYARRRRCAQIVWNDSVRTYLPEFPWAQLAERIRYKCDEAEMEFSLASGEADGKPA